MSRLADMLMRMDRGASRPEGVGGIPRLTISVTRSPRWRQGLLFVIVVSVLAVGVAVMLRPKNAGLIAAPAPARVASPRPAPEAAPPVTSDEGFVALLGQGRRAALEGALPESAELLKKALELKPTDAEAWNSLGVVLVRQGETARGIDAFSRALRFSPNHAEGHRNLAVALDRQGRPGEAVAHYRAFLRLTPGNHPARDDVSRRLAEVSASKAEERAAARGEPSTSGDRAGVSDPQ